MGDIDEIPDVDNYVPECGNGVKEEGEQCDDGADNGKYGFCLADCSGPGERCGDSAVQDTVELCDGNTIKCNLIEGMGYVNEVDASCLGTCDGWDTSVCECDTGYEKDVDGKCIDIDECTTSTHNCDANADCENTPGSFTCTCKDYYDGDGTSCTFCDQPNLCGTNCLECTGDTLKCKDNGDGTTVCVQCVQETDCEGDKPHCLLDGNTCVECRDDNDCNTAGGEVCRTDNHTCAVNTCGDGFLGGNILEFIEGFESGSRPGYSSGTDWSVSSTQVHGGTYSLESSDPGDGYYSSIAMIKYTDGEICFWYAGESESGWDYFTVYVDGDTKLEVSGDHKTWTEKCITVSPGYPMLVFEYYKDDMGGSTGWDAYFVDDIKFHGAAQEQCEVSQTTNCTSLGYDNSQTVQCGSDCTWQAAEDGCEYDDSW